MSDDPSKVSDSFLRFCYFSAIVITTVGPGDIVPLTPEARFFLGLEAILGISFSGMFINSLSASQSTPRATNLQATLRDELEQIERAENE